MSSGGRVYGDRRECGTCRWWRPGGREVVNGSGIYEEGWCLVDFRWGGLAERVVEYSSCDEWEMGGD